MARPLRRLCFRISREWHIDVDKVASWQVSKIYEHLAFLMTDDPEWKKEYDASQITPEEKRALLLAAMKASVGK